MKVDFRESFKKDLSQIDDRNAKTKIREIIEQIESARDTHSIRNLKKIRGHNSYYRIRFGDYRIGLKVEEETITFVRVLHRSEIYRYFP